MKKTNKTTCCICLIYDICIWYSTFSTINFTVTYILTRPGYICVSSHICSVDIHTETLYIKFLLFLSKSQTNLCKSNSISRFNIIWSHIDSQTIRIQNYDEYGQLFKVFKCQPLTGWKYNKKLIVKNSFMNIV
jgi:hypothetical protein